MQAASWSGCRHRWQVSIRGRQDRVFAPKPVFSLPLTESILESFDAVSEVSAPVSTTVIAFDVAGANPADAAALVGFDRIVAMARSLGFVTHDPGNLSLTLTLAPESEVASALCQLAASVVEFDRSSPPLRIRAMVHHGVVFRAESAGQTSYVGSAIRSTQSALRRAPAGGGFTATNDFATYASTLTSLPFRFEAMTGPAAAERTCHVIFASGAVKEVGPAPAGTGPAPIDEAFVEFAKHRLAEDVGPFAAALVERAVRSSTALEQLLPALSREIEGSMARARFEKDILHYVESRTEK